MATLPSTEKAPATRIRAIVASYDASVILLPCGRCRELIFQVDHANLAADVVLAVDKVVKLRELRPYAWQAHRPT